MPKSPESPKSSQPEAVVEKTSDNKDIVAEVESVSDKVLQERIAERDKEITSSIKEIQDKLNYNKKVDYLECVEEADRVIKGTEEFINEKEKEIEGSPENTLGDLTFHLDNLKVLRYKMGVSLQSEVSEKEEIEKEQKILEKIQNGEDKGTETSKSEEVGGANGTERGKSKIAKEESPNRTENSQEGGGLETQIEQKTADDCLRRASRLLACKNMLERREEPSGGDKDFLKREFPEQKNISVELLEREYENSMRTASMAMVINGLRLGNEGYKKIAQDGNNPAKSGDIYKNYKENSEGTYYNVLTLRNLFEMNRQKDLPEGQSNAFDKYTRELGVEIDGDKADAGWNKIKEANYTADISGQDVELIGNQSDTTGKKNLLKKILQMAKYEEYIDEIANAAINKKVSIFERESLDLEGNRSRFILEWYDSQNVRKRVEVIVDLKGEKKAKGFFDRKKNRTVEINVKEFREIEEEEDESEELLQGGGESGLETEEENNGINKIKIDEKIKKEYPKTAEFSEYMIEKMNEEAAVSVKAEVENLLGQQKEEESRDQIDKILVDIKLGQEKREKELGKEYLDKLLSLGEAALGELEDKIAARGNDEEPKENTETIEFEEGVWKEYPKTAVFYRAVLESAGDDEETISGTKEIENTLEKGDRGKVIDHIKLAVKNMEESMEPDVDNLSEDKKKRIEEALNMAGEAIEELKRKEAEEEASEGDDEGTENIGEPEVNAETIKPEDPKRKWEKRVVATESGFSDVKSDKKRVKWVGFKPNLKGGAEGEPDRSEENNGNPIKIDDFKLNGKKVQFERIFQKVVGDCGPAAILNTLSFKSDGKLHYTIRQIREMASDLRGKRSEEEAKSYGMTLEEYTSDVLNPAKELTHDDIVYLLEKLTGQSPRQENVMNIDVVNRTIQAGDIIVKDVDLDKKMDEVLDRVVGTEYKTLVLGTKNHAKTLISLGNEEYAFIDPMQKTGAEKINSKESAKKRLMEECKGDKNFFYIVGK